jgi:hypothetical protein
LLNKRGLHKRLLNLQRDSEQSNNNLSLDSRFCCLAAHLPDSKSHGSEARPRHREGHGDALLTGLSTSANTWATLAKLSLDALSSEFFPKENPMPDFVLTPGLITGGISAVTSLTKLFSNFRELNSFQILRKGLQSIKELSPGKIPTDEKEREELVIQLLAQSEFVIAGLKRRLLSRFAIALPILVACSVAISADFAGGDVFKIKGVESYDIVIVAFQMFIAFSSTSSSFLGDTEKQFLSHVSVLHARFYRKYVRTAMFEFNEQVKYFNFLDLEYDEEKRAYDKIQKLIQEAFKLPKDQDQTKQLK